MTEGQERNAAVQSMRKGCQQHSTPCGCCRSTAATASMRSTKRLRASQLCAAIPHILKRAALICLT